MRLGFRAQGLGGRVEGFRVQGFRVQGFTFVVIINAAVNPQPHNAAMLELTAAKYYEAQYKPRG